MVEHSVEITDCPSCGKEINISLLDLQKTDGVVYPAVSNCSCTNTPSKECKIDAFSGIYFTFFIGLFF